MYIGYALAGWNVGLQAAPDGSVRIWFFQMLLGAFVPGRETTLQPCIAETADIAPITDEA